MEDNRLKLTADDLEEWRSHPVTQRLLDLMGREIQFAKNKTQSTIWATGETDLRMIGMIDGASDFVFNLQEATLEALERKAEALS